MFKIESRPIPDRPFEYRFFIDFEGNLADPAVKNALRGICCQSLHHFNIVNLWAAKIYILDF